MRTGKRLPRASSRPSPARTGQKPTLQFLGQVEGFAHGADGGGVLLEQELEGRVLEERPTAMPGDGAGGVLGEEVLHVLGDELQPQPVLPGAFRHRDHEGGSLRVLHDAPHLVHHQQPGPGVLGGRRPHRLGADHGGGGTQFRLQQVQVEHRHQGLAGQQVVALVGEQVPQAAGGEGAQQVGDLRRLLLQVGVEVPEAGALPALGVVGGQGVVQRRSALGAEPFPHHHLDEAAQAADALQEFLAVAPVDDKGVHALAGHAGGKNPAASGPCHVGVLALRVDDVGPHAPAQPAQHPQLGGKGLAAARPRQDGGVGVEVGAVEGVVDDGGAGPQVDAVEGAAPGVQVRRREGEQPGQ